MRFSVILFGCLSVVLIIFFLLKMFVAVPTMERQQKWIDACKAKQGTPIINNGKPICGKIEIFEIDLAY